jgi:hypothetical protein
MSGSPLDPLTHMLTSAAIFVGAALAPCSAAMFLTCVAVSLCSASGQKAPECTQWLRVRCGAPKTAPAHRPQRCVPANWTGPRRFPPAAWGRSSLFVAARLSF